jgi:two-component system, LytTR family, response regulator
MTTCMAIDDEPLALELLGDYIGKVPYLQLLHTNTSAIEALQYLQNNKVDLLFLDIQMPDLTGLQVMKIIQQNCRVILTTAYSEYALDGYEHNVIDYLLKPISFDRFYTAAEKARTIFTKPVDTSVPIVPATPNFIFVKTDSRLVKVNLEDILLVEGMKDYIAIHTTQDKLITLQSLRSMEDSLPTQQFIRIHKSFIIALNKIDSIERNRIFINKEVIPIGDTYREFFFKLIEK